MTADEYIGSDGNRYRYRETPEGLVHESYDGIDQEGEETWVESAVVDEGGAATARRRYQRDAWWPE